MSDSELDKSPISTKRAREASIGEEEQATTVTDPKDQLKIVTQLQEQHLKDNETWCLVSKTWYTRWKQYCSRLNSPAPEVRNLGQQSPPGPINNISILSNGKLAEDLVLDDTVYAVPESAWDELISWYGATPDSIEPIKRLVISTDDEKTVELYPPQFKLYSVEATNGKPISQLKRCPVITLSQTSLVTEFMSAVKNAFDLQESTEIQVWRLREEPLGMTPNISVQLLNQALLVETDGDDATLGHTGQCSIAIEVKEGDSYPSDQLKRQSDSSSVSSASSVFANGFNNLTTSSVTTPPPPPPPSVPRFTRGVCGLQNLGNTCFMNSALQCLSNTPQLTKWFLADNYKKDLNRDNPLGMKGQVAEAYGELIERLWSGQAHSIPPRDFKYTIGRFNSSFSGYQQHDTQELLAFLLDGLHEDLNRIIKKPYIELPDFDGMKDAEIAKRSWDYHRARNDSVIVDLFQGQFKSRLICEECRNVSVTFDPFMYLSLPLPIKKKSKVTIVYVPYDPSQQLQRVVVTLSKEASIAHLQKEVAKMMAVDDPNSLLVIELFSHKIYKVYPQYEPVASIGASDIIYVYQLPGAVPPVPKKKARYSYSRYSAPSEDDEEKQPIDENQLIVFPVYCATVSKNENSYNSNSERISQFGDPMILAVPRKDANKPELLYHLVLQHIERYANIKLFEEVKENSTNPFLTEEEQEQPPGYESVMAEQDRDAIIVTESSSPINDDMEVDSTPSNNLIHTAAAVTPAGGKKVEPISNLFTMKVFSAPRSYSREPDELLPSVQNWSGLVDLHERAQAEQKQREEYMKQQEGTESESESDTEMEDSLVLPNNTMDQDDDQVEDAAALFGNTSSNAIDTPDQADEDETEADDHDSMDNASFHSDNNSDNFMAGKPLSPLIAPAPLATTPVLPKHKVVCPPSTIIRQGEGILLEWTPRKAQELFGTARLHSNESGVCTEAWNSIHNLGDPNIESNQTNQKKQVTLSDCLDEFTKEEELSEEDLWYCPKCKKHQRATKKFDLWRMPEIMVVHLKRFSHSRTWRDKIDALIDFPASELDLTDRVLSIEDHTKVKDEDRLIYDLYGVDNHFGGLGGGHYTSFAQNFEDGNWYNFDDSHVTKVDVSDVKTTAAYLLFYKRRRLGNDEPTKTVEEIIREAKEKQQAAEDQQVVVLQTPKTKQDHYHNRGYLAASDSESEADQPSLQKEALPPVVLATTSKKTEDTTSNHNLDLMDDDDNTNNTTSAILDEKDTTRSSKAVSEEII